MQPGRGPTREKRRVREPPATEDPVSEGMRLRPGQMSIIEIDVRADVDHVT